MASRRPAPRPEGPPARLAVLLALLTVLLAAYLAARPHLARMREETRRMAAQGSAAGHPRPDPAPAPDPIEQRRRLSERVRAGSADAREFCELAALLAPGDAAAAREVLARGARLHPRSVSIRAELGMLHQAHGRLEAAIAAFAAANRLDPRNPRVASALASLYAGLGWAREAGAVLDAATAGRTDPSLSAARAAVYIQTGAYKPALELLSPLVELPGTPPEIHVLAGQAHAGEGAYESAVGAFERAHLLDPRRADLREHLSGALISLGTPGALERAASLAAEGAEQHPDDPALRRAHGLALRRLGRLPEAWRLLRPLAETEERDAILLGAVAACLRAMNRPEEAERFEARARAAQREAERFSRLRSRAAFSREPAAITALAAEYHRQGENERARLELSRALRLDPRHAAARALRARLGEGEARE